MSMYSRGNAPILDSQGELTNPTTATVIADSGVVAFRGLYEVRVIIGGSVAAQFQLQRRNAANGANVGDVVGLYGAAGQSSQFVLNYYLDAGERVRLMMDDNLTGTAYCAITVEQRD